MFCEYPELKPGDVPFTSVDLHFDLKFSIIEYTGVVKQINYLIVKIISPYNLPSSSYSMFMLHSVFLPKYIVY